MDFDETRQRMNKLYKDARDAKRRKIYAAVQAEKLDEYKALEATKIAQLKAKQVQILDELKAKQATEIAQLIAAQEDELWEAEQSSMSACSWRETYPFPFSWYSLKC